MSSSSLVGAVTLRGRVASSRVQFGPHETNLAYRREMSDRHVAYYARRAAGGAGVIVTEVASVHGSDHPYERAPLAADCGPGWTEVVRACRPHGALVLAGLGHAGAQGSTAYGPMVLWGPSRVADVASREVPMEMEQPEIDAMVAGFAEAAAIAADAGLDGVEVDAGQYSLLRQFRSGLTNHRTDGYGRDRDRLLREVLAAVRAAVGEDLVVGVRLCGHELAYGAGITPDGAAATAATLTGVDLLTVVRGSGMTVHETRPDMDAPEGFNRPLCAGIRAVLGPRGPLVVLQGSVVDPAMAQAALDDRVADLVEMTRAQIAEPDLVALVRAGTPERVRPCTLSNQQATARDPRNPIVSDDAEPSAGHELDDLPVEGTDPHPRDVLVVGGGPAGLEAARVLALRGHTVRLVERQHVLGGAIRLAAAVCGRSRFGLLVDWWERELHRLGVQVRTGVGVTAVDLGRFAPGGGVLGRGALDMAAVGPAAVDGAVLLATGSRPLPPPSPADCPVLDAAACEAAVLVAGTIRAMLREMPAGTAVVHDPIGDWTGVGIAWQIVMSGWPVALVTPDPVVGSRLSRTGALVQMNGRLERAGVAREIHSVLRSVSNGRAVLEHVWTGERREIGCGFVVDCGHRLPEDTLWQARPDLPRVGDCVAPRTVYEAVLEGRRAALALGAGRM